jgi:hypothetical protein
VRDVRDVGERGVIAQFQFGLGANPDTALAVFDEWAKWDAAARGRLA